MGNERWESGCYADASFGWDHVRIRLSYLLDSGAMDPLRRARASEIAGLRAELEGEPSDDGSEEYDALDLLNEAAEASGDTRVWYFDEYAGGLFFGEPESKDE